jgi:hypothetical protein
MQFWMMVIPVIAGCGGAGDKLAGSDTGNSAPTEADADTDADFNIDDDGRRHLVFEALTSVGRSETSFIQTDSELSS